MGLTLGIDLGGTKVLAGVIDAKTGKVLGSGKKRSRAEHTSSDIVARLLEAANAEAAIIAATSAADAIHLLLTDIFMHRLVGHAQHSSSRR